MLSFIVAAAVECRHVMMILLLDTCLWNLCSKYRQGSKEYDPQ